MKKKAQKFGSYSKSLTKIYYKHTYVINIILAKSAENIMLKIHLI